MLMKRRPNLSAFFQNTSMSDYGVAATMLQKKTYIGALDFINVFSLVILVSYINKLSHTHVFLSM